jgi:16S rRNA (cytidine1402-2'-O)-methyltransferase
VAGQAAEAPRLPPGLYLVATPIGNLRDITLRALETLAGADLVACEDTRVTRKLFDHYGLSAPLIAYHDHNAATARPKILDKLAAGGAVALVSDAGTPLISDPGYRLVRAAAEAGHPVTAAPGPSAALMALTVAGLPTDRFFFDGFLPAKETARRARIAEIARIPATLVLFESGRASPRPRRSRGGLWRARRRDRAGTDQAARGGPRGTLAARARLCGGRETRGGVRHRDRRAPRRAAGAAEIERCCGRARAHS